MLRWLLLLTLLFACSTPGCSRDRVITISAVPADAMLRVDGSPRGRGPLTETFTFSGDTVSHTVTAQRVGYSDQVVTVMPDFPGDSLVVRLKPAARRVTIRVRPVPAVVSVNGKKLAVAPVEAVTADLEFPVGPGGKSGVNVIRAEHPNFAPVERTVTYDDADREFVLNLDGTRKDLRITTVPDKAEVFINDQTLGTSPVNYTGFEFPIDEATGAHRPLPLRIEKRGYQPFEGDIGWDGGQEEYTRELKPLSKRVQIVTEPPDARVVLDGVDVPLDEAGAHTADVDFVPINDAGDPPTFECHVSKDDLSPQTVNIGWDDGQTEYTVKLAEVATRPVPMLRLRTRRNEQGWVLSGQSGKPLAMRDTVEPGEGRQPVQVTRSEAGTQVDSLAVAPDGSRVVFTTLSVDAVGAMRSQIFVQKTDGSAAEPTPLTDGKSLDVTPAFTPDGGRVVFASDRAGPKLSLWSSPAANGTVGKPQQLTAGESHDLWPSVDSDPKPRLFYQSLTPVNDEPRLLTAPLGPGAAGRDLGPPGGGEQPRVGPTADAVVFAAVDGPGGKRDLFRMSDTGEAVTNLTNTPDVDEFDPAWSHDGRRVAFAADAGRSADAPDNYDVYVLDLTQPEAEPARVTQNGSWDDCPAWDVGGRALYFRSNRGGAWNVWRVDLK